MSGALLAGRYVAIAKEGRSSNVSIGNGARGRPRSPGAVLAQLMSLGVGCGSNHSRVSGAAAALLSRSFRALFSRRCHAPKLTSTRF